MKIALAQLRSSADPFENLFLVDAFIKEAASHGADLVCFPENVFCRGPRNNPLRESSVFQMGTDHKPLSNTDFAKCFLELWNEWPIHVSLGSVLEQSGQGNPFNSHWLLKPKQQEIVSYKKIHLFCFDSGSAQYNEALDFSPGEHPVRAQVENWNLGLSICYDLRFPELFRHLVFNEGCHALLVPAAFTRTTGEAHWHTLLRARAIENQSYVLACGQWGSHFDASGKELFCYGHTLAYDPWGNLLAEAPSEGDALLLVDLNMEHLKDVRKKLPALENAFLGLTRDKKR